MKTIEEYSAGGVVYREVDGRLEFLIGKHSGYHKWVLAKGFIERGESSIEAAEREVEEELGVEVEVVGSKPIEAIEYYYQADFADVVGRDAKGEESTRRVEKYQEAPDFAEATTGESGSRVTVHKRVDFYLMKYASDLGKEGWEMSGRKWVSYEEGMETLAFESEQGVLRSAYEKIGMGAPGGN